MVGYDVIFSASKIKTNKERLTVMPANEENRKESKEPDYEEDAARRETRKGNRETRNNKSGFLNGL